LHTYFLCALLRIYFSLCSIAHIVYLCALLHTVIHDCASLQKSLSVPYCTFTTPCSTCTCIAYVFLSMLYRLPILTSVPSCTYSTVLYYTYNFLLLNIYIYFFARLFTFLRSANSACRSNIFLSVIYRSYIFIFVPSCTYATVLYCTRIFLCARLHLGCFSSPSFFANIAATTSTTIYTIANAAHTPIYLCVIAHIPLGLSTAHMPIFMPYCTYIYHGLALSCSSPQYNALLHSNCPAILFSCSLALTRSFALSRPAAHGNSVGVSSDVLFVVTTTTSHHTTPYLATPCHTAPYRFGVVCMVCMVCMRVCMIHHNAFTNYYSEIYYSNSNYDIISCVIDIVDIVDYGFISTDVALVSTSMFGLYVSTVTVGKGILFHLLHYNHTLQRQLFYLLHYNHTLQQQSFAFVSLSPNTNLNNDSANGKIDDVKMSDNDDDGAEGYNLEDYSGAGVPQHYVFQLGPGLSKILSGTASDSSISLANLFNFVHDIGKIGASWFCCLHFLLMLPLLCWSCFFSCSLEAACPTLLALHLSCWGSSSFRAPPAPPHWLATLCGFFCVWNSPPLFGIYPALKSNFFDGSDHSGQMSVFSYMNYFSDSLFVWSSTVLSGPAFVFRVFCSALLYRNNTAIYKYIDLKHLTDLTIKSVFINCLIFISILFTNDLADIFTKPISIGVFKRPFCFVFSLANFPSKLVSFQLKGGNWFLYSRTSSALFSLLSGCLSLDPCVPIFSSFVLIGSF